VDNDGGSADKKWTNFFKNGGAEAIRHGPFLDTVFLMEFPARTPCSIP